LGVDVFLGDARFSGDGTVQVGPQTLRYKRAVIATGARAAAPNIPGLREAGYLTNETVFSLTELPPRLAVIGGGPIGCELAQGFARFGSRVSLLEMADQILPREDRDAAEIVANSLRRDGVELLTGSSIREVQTSGAGKTIVFDRDHKSQEREVDAILLGVGRQPNVEGLNLEAVGVDFDSRMGVRVDDKLRTTNRRIFAAGDVCFPYKFTHMADALARIVIQNALFVPTVRASRLLIPWCTYTEPEIAHVGLYEHEARARHRRRHVRAAVERRGPGRTRRRRRGLRQSARARGRGPDSRRDDRGRTCRRPDFRDHRGDVRGHRSEAARRRDPPLSHASGSHPQAGRPVQPPPSDAAA
jgi:pyruvate/2-oxoglutarate dehydrogenase complex dihydrolipoamide dehydrogenase (E3) component